MVPNDDRRQNLEMKIQRFFVKKKPAKTYTFLFKNAIFCDFVLTWNEIKIKLFTFQVQSEKSAGKKFDQKKFFRVKLLSNDLLTVHWLKFKDTNPIFVYIHP
jgi:hypothetical protein